MAKQITDGQRNWYAIHTYAGYENAVARNLKQRIESLNVEDQIFAVVVPVEKEDKDKSRQASRRRGKDLSGLCPRGHDRQ